MRKVKNSGPVSASWMGKKKKSKKSRKPQWTYTTLKYNEWMWKEKCLEEKKITEKGILTCKEKQNWN